MDRGGMVVGLAALVFVAVALLCVLGALRIRWIWSRGGVFECQLRQERPVVRPWHSGLARYEGNHLGWYRVLSLGRRPNVVIRRRQAELVEYRPPAEADLQRLTVGQQVVAVAQRTGPSGHALWQLGMDTECLTGFMSWLEAGPPGEGRRHQTNPR